jgi:hypothetical protein
MLCAFIMVTKLVNAVGNEFAFDRKVMAFGLMLGFGYGVFMVWSFWNAFLFMRQWFDARNAYRTERLLFKYYDQVKEQEASNHPVEPASPDSAAHR